MSGKSPSKKSKPSDGKKTKDAKGEGKGSPGSSKDAEKARHLQQLSAELVLAQGRLAALEVEQRENEAELQVVRDKQEKDNMNYGDVLRNQQREQDSLQQHTRELELQLGAAQRQLEDLHSELQAAQDETLCEDEADGGEVSGYKRLVSAARRKDDVIARQEAALVQLQEKLQQAHQSLFDAHEKIKNLEYKASGRAKLLFVFDEPCLARIERHRLTGKLPLQHAGHVLCCTGERWLVQYGTSPGGGEGQGCAAAVNVLDLHSWRWQPGFREPSGEVLEGHVAVAVKNKLVAFGGSSAERLLSGPRLFSPDEMGWVQVPPLADASSLMPCPRKGHALVFCRASNSIYLFGGMGEGRQLLNDLWRLRMDTYQWTQLGCLRSTSRAHLHSPSSSSSSSSMAGQGDGLPQPSCNAALAVSEDGSRLWLSGGSTKGGKCQSALWWYEVPSQTWSLVQPNPDSVYVEPRESHIMCCVRRWLLVAGGSCKQSTGGRKELRDTLVFDTLVNAWDCIDANCWAAPDPQPATGSFLLHSSTPGGTPRDPGPAGAPPQFLNSSNCTFSGSSLIMLKRNAAGEQDELVVVQLGLLDEIAKRRMQKRASLIVIEHLELLDAAQVSANSISVAWVAPTKNAHKLLGFKLMMHTASGGAKEVYEGKERNFELTGLAADTEYIFAVKAVYDDASFLWSESKAFKTHGKNKA